MSKTGNLEKTQRTGLPADWYADGLVWPDFSGGGLFNLAVSIARACGANVAPDYLDLILPSGAAASQSWARADTLVFFLIDGLGDAFLSRNRDVAPNLWRERVQSLTSVFPSTTATAITTLMTAQPAAVHGLLGWYVRDEATNSIIAPLPMRHRNGSAVDDVALLARLLQAPPMLETARRQSRFVTLPELADGPYSRYHRREVPVRTYETLDDLASSIFQACADMNGSNEQKYVYAYTPLLDATGHDFGMESRQARDVLARIDDAYARMRNLLPRAQFVVSADHGFIDNPPARQINLSDHADLHAMLRGPMTGERRAAYCHVKPECQSDFGALIAERFGDRLCAIPAAVAFEIGLFGPGQSVQASLRSGDWLLVPRDDWTVLDLPAGDQGHVMLGVHGGLSAGEMNVPLILSPGN
ncbi:MAG: type phosphodiesterase/nucleotide pyrophosphatase [Rhodocyclales bacterium]|nr:type phosphodiesterase/nucleotide pyrophosphatase [Rhodocyclales bacterium]